MIIAAEGGEVTVRSPEGDAVALCPPSGWLAEVWDATGEMGRDVNGDPLASERFAVIDRSGLDRESGEVARRLWRAMDAGRHAAHERRRRDAEMKGRRR